MSTVHTLSKSTSLTPTCFTTAILAALALTACGPRSSPDAGSLVGNAPVTSSPARMPQGSTEVAPLVGQAPSGTSVPQAVSNPQPPVVAGQYQYPMPPLSASTQATPAYPQPTPTYAPVPERRVAEARPADRNDMGSVERIEPIRDRPQGSGAGAVIGGVLGAVVGNQFGHSTGRAAMTGLGAVGGAVAGNNVERNHREGITGYRVSVRLDNGTTRTYDRTDLGNLQVGDRVHLDAKSFHRV